uniref:7TM_GPCR_Srx domain-containing protein n=1 Tax=Globodera pallida TaxID=36090 RepID=A0A183CIB0_GLOPA
MINITSDSPPSEAVMLSGSVLSYAELVVHPISLMTSFFSVALIINTSVLHSNLKCILLGQCAGIVMYEIARIVYVVIKFMAGNVFFQGPIAIQMIGLFGYTLRNLTLIFLQVYNLRKYRSSRTGINLSLNDKYQISENIRTARQLAPTFVLHFLNACVNNGMSFLIFFGVIQHSYSISLGFIISSLFNGFSGSLVDLIVIIKKLSIGCCAFSNFKEDPEDKYALKTKLLHRSDNVIS